VQSPLPPVPGVTSRPGPLPPVASEGFRLVPPPRVPGGGCRFGPSPSWRGASWRSGPPVLPDPSARYGWGGRGSAGWPSFRRRAPAPGSRRLPGWRRRWPPSRCVPTFSKSSESVRNAFIASLLSAVPRRKTMLVLAGKFRWKLSQRPLRVGLCWGSSPPPSGKSADRAEKQTKIGFVAGRLACRIVDRQRPMPRLSELLLVLLGSTVHMHYELRVVKSSGQFFIIFSFVKAAMRLGMRGSGRRSSLGFREKRSIGGQVREGGRDGWGEKGGGSGARGSAGGLRPGGRVAARVARRRENPGIGGRRRGLYPVRGGLR
jgi:hypothetical protein